MESNEQIEQIEHI